MVRIFRNIITLAIFFTVVIVPTANAQLTSPSYKEEETFFGTGGELDASSPNYIAKQAAGELAVGNATSSSYQFNAGFNTTDAELLEVAVTGGVFDLDVLDTATTHALSTVFTVRNYLASGYVVRLSGTSLRSVSGGSYVIPPLLTPTAASPGTEQFGVNVVANTLSTSNPAVGANPVQIPDNTFSFGAAATDYDTPDLFKFVDNDVIAESLTSSGMTEYTLSFMANINLNTPSGSYGASLAIIVIPSF